MTSLSDNPSHDAEGPSRPTDAATSRGVRKSRNGCSTCKQKRRKCDETRPSCLRCRYHNIECPGYEQNIKWRPASVPSIVRKQSNNVVRYADNPRATAQSQRSKAGSETRPHINPERQDSDLEALEYQRQIQPPILPSLSPRLGSSWSWRTPEITPDTDVSRMRPEGDNHSYTNDLMADLVFDSLNVENLHAAHFDLNEFANPPHHQPIWQIAPQPHLSSVTRRDGAGNGINVANSNTTPDRVAESIHESPSTNPSLAQPSPQVDGYNYLEYPVLVPSLSSPREFHLSTPPRRYDLPDDRPEDIKRLFDRHTSRHLSISDDPGNNSWLVTIWPLSFSYSPLYHSLAAMTCFHNSAKSPELQPLGVRHLDCAIDGLSLPVDDDENNTATMGAHIATMITLACLKLWHVEDSTAGLSYMADVKTLIKEVATQQGDSQIHTEELKPIGYLINTWLYLDVMTRFGFSGPVGHSHEGFMKIFNLSSPTSPPEYHIDSLVGFATTLFPLLSRLADLTAQVRRMSGKRSSLDHISKASDLRAAFERWAPDFDIDSVPEAKQLHTDAIQTAEAYRWAGLLLLRQAVPEIPWAQSQADLAHMSLSYLATISRESPTVVSHIFPLLVAGVEAVEQDNKEWIRTKWEYMSEANMAHAARFREIAEEVWRRREEFEKSDGYISKTRSDPILTEGDGCQGVVGLDYTTFSNTKAHGPTNNQRLRLRSSKFPDSLAFRKDIDPYTRAGLPEYTVRGSLHFLTVMSEWKCELILG